MNTEIPNQLLPFLVPLIMLQGALIIISLVKLSKLKMVLLQSFKSTIK
ncbi:hypothetical protein [Streptococcus agalactiae]|nr:hypothetical protein [Streptococcus agalactiae]